MIKFDEVIHDSFTWTMRMLFKPFRLKKWLILGFIALMAGALGGGGHLNIPSSSNHASSSKKTSAASLAQSEALVKPVPTIQQQLSAFKQTLLRHRVLVAGCLVLFLAFIVLMAWVSSRFRFIFLSSIVHDDASIRKPFRELRALGNSLWGFSLICSVIFFAFLAWIFIGCYRHLQAMGVFIKPEQIGAWKIFLGILPFILWFVVFCIVAGLFSFLLYAFVVPLMFCTRQGIMKAWGDSFRLIRHNAGNTVVFALINFALAIAVGLAYMIVALILVLGVVLVALIIGLLGYFLYHALAPSLHVFLAIVAVVIGIPVALALGFAITCLYLPAAVFLNCFNLRFLEHVDQRYIFFKVENQPGTQG